MELLEFFRQSQNRCRALHQSVLLLRRESKLESFEMTLLQLSVEVKKKEKEKRNN